MLPSEAGPGAMRSPYVRFFMRMDEIHGSVGDQCGKCAEPIPCDTMRAFHIYSLETRPGGMP